MGPLAQRCFVSAGAWGINSPMSRNGQARLSPDIGRMPTCFPSAVWVQHLDGARLAIRRLSHDEQRTLMTLWCIFPSPLMIGGELPSADDWTISLLTNPEVLAVDQHSKGNRPVISTEKTVIWLADSSTNDGQYIAIFNISPSETALRYEWKELGLSSNAYQLRDLWQHKDLGSADSLTVTLPPHASVLYRLSPPKTEH